MGGNVGALPFVLLALVGLRFPLLYLSAGLGFPIWATMTYLYGTYLLSSLAFMALFSQRSEYGFSAASLILFALSPILSAVVGQDLSQAIKVPLSLVILGFLFWYGRKEKLAIRPPRFRPRSLIHFLVAILSGILVGYTIWMVSGSQKMDHSMNPVTVYSTVTLFLFQLSFAATSEEPLFRGFLWGVLEKKIRSPLVTALLVALLFWLGHLYYIDKPMVFWVVQPLGALTLSLVMLVTRNIGYTMLTHCLLNLVPETMRFL